MAPTDLNLTQATRDEIDRIVQLLTTNGLPVADVSENYPEFFIASAGDTVIGCGGLEDYGTVGLLRSIVITEAHRGHGNGTELCRALEKRAQANGVDTLYLLTVSAEAFFCRLGYVPIDRNAVPAVIRQTTEFAEFCPQSARPMKKALGNVDYPAKDRRSNLLHDG